MKTLLITTALLFSLTPTAYAESYITTMAPISDRDEPKISSEEVTEKLEARYWDTPFVRFEEREESRREDIATRNLDEDAERDIRCLTEAILFEALGEPKDGKIAVANVIMNRANWTPTNERNKHHYEFSKSICDVVAFKVSKRYAKRVGNKRHSKWIHRTYTTCAFSYRCERGFRSKLQRYQKREVWNEIKTLATDAYLSYNSGENEDPSGGATFYHATWMKKYPWWSRTYKRTAKIGLHQFYRIE
jgi:spore germination cell wall hydrolase CwlJ-like protein